ncbi:15192_t:CDS:1 [Funneliformis mosseae]|uniref:15192_t:CDS:1 n=1 Tax=Funneliformis mosseae TaxID=27381 RepID=A0A9N9C9F1_FUNMO|nr:15192_t:CDS:1 [Funneliformis mosseae]
MSYINWCICNKPYHKIPWYVKDSYYWDIGFFICSHGCYGCVGSDSQSCRSELEIENDSAIIIQRNVRKWLDKRKRAARVITNAILAWYYRPDGPRMKIAEESFKN